MFLLFFREKYFKTEAERLRKELESADEKQRSATEMKVCYCCANSKNDFNRLGIISTLFAVYVQTTMSYFLIDRNH